MAGQFNVYKSKAALQASLQQAEQDPDNSHRVKSGGIWLNVANSNGKRSYDWDNKIVMKLGVSDIQRIVSQSEVDLIHKSPRDDSIRSVKIEPGQNEGTWRFLFSGPAVSGQKTSVSIFLDSGEMMVFRKLLYDSVADIIGWKV